MSEPEFWKRCPHCEKMFCRAGQLKNHTCSAKASSAKASSAKASSTKASAGTSSATSTGFIDLFFKEIENAPVKLPEDDHIWIKQHLMNTEKLRSASAPASPAEPFSRNLHTASGKPKPKPTPATPRLPIPITEALKTLGNPTFERIAINKAYHKLAMEMHPDKFLDKDKKEEANKKFQILNDAHKRLVKYMDDPSSGGSKRRICRMYRKTKKMHRHKRHRKTQNCLISKKNKI